MTAAELSVRRRSHHPPDAPPVTRMTLPARSEYVAAMNSSRLSPGATDALSRKRVLGNIAGSLVPCTDQKANCARSLRKRSTAGARVACRKMLKASDRWKIRG